MTTLPARTPVAAALVHTTVAWCGVLLALAILAGVADAAIVHVAADSSERWRGSGALVASNAAPDSSNTSEELELERSPMRHESAAPVVVTLAFPNGDGSAGTLACQTSTDRLAADTLVFATEAEALDVAARLCAGAR